MRYQLIHLLAVFSKETFPSILLHSGNSNPHRSPLHMWILRSPTAENNFKQTQSNTDFSHFIGFSLNQKSAKRDNHHCNCAIKLKQKSNAEILPWIFSRNDDNREILRMQPSYQNRGWDQFFHHKKDELRIANCQLGCSMLQV